MSKDKIGKKLSKKAKRREDRKFPVHDAEVATPTPAIKTLPDDENIIVDGSQPSE